VLIEVKKVLEALPSLVDVDVPEGTHINVCGDTHGQYYDLLNIFELHGYPSETNPYLFNGDFVDRGSFSVEVVLLLFCFKVLYPQHLHLTRGNHESLNMNKVYGFEGEVRHKYSAQMFQLYTEVFHCLPLAYVLGKKALSYHALLIAIIFLYLFIILRTCRCSSCTAGSSRATTSRSTISERSTDDASRRMRGSCRRSCGATRRWVCPRRAPADEMESPRCIAEMCRAVRTTRIARRRCRGVRRASGASASRSAPT